MLIQLHIAEALSSALLRPVPEAHHIPIRQIKQFVAHTEKQHEKCHSALLFKICHKMDRVVRLIGEGPRFNMVKKALARQGIEADSNLSNEIIIEVDGDSYNINGRLVKSIGSLLDAVKELI